MPSNFSHEVARHLLSMHSSLEKEKKIISMVYYIKCSDTNAQRLSCWASVVLSLCHADVHTKPQSKWPKDVIIQEENYCVSFQASSFYLFFLYSQVLLDFIFETLYYDIRYF